MLIILLGHILEKIAVWQCFTRFLLAKDLFKSQKSVVSSASCCFQCKQYVLAT